MKHKLIALLLVPVLLLSIQSCNKRLDIIPFQSLTPEAGLKTEGDLVGLLIGCYDRASSTTGYGGDIQLMADLWANRLYQRFRGSFNGLLQIASVTTTSNLILVDNGWATSLWQNAYRTINGCNLVLENLNLSNGDIRNKSWLEGEALFLRGSMYFELARFYGKPWDTDNPANNSTNLAVPLVLKSTPFEESKLTAENYPARATVAQIYNQAIQDLQRAETLLPATRFQHYATRWAAKAMLARIALMQHNYTTARDKANEVIQSGLYPLTQDFNNLWFNFINFAGVAPSEYVFYIRVTTQDGTNGLNTYYGQTVSSIPGTAGRGDIDVQTAWVNLHEVGDFRRTYFTITNRRLTRKHLDRFGHVPVIRSAEMFLTRAEANFRLGTSVGAAPEADVNTIRNRVGLASVGSVTLNDIIRQRHLELAFEGHYLHDIKRLRQAMPGSNGTNGPAWNSPRLIMPIPQREMDVNKNLVQNEGYN